MWKKIRLLCALLCLLGFAILFCDQSENGLFASHFAWLAKVQLVPAILTGSLLVLVALAVLTLLLGRVYCSVICPLGLLQDVIGVIPKKRGFSFSPARPVIRYAFLAIFALSLLLGLPIVYTMLEPYSIFGRIATDLGRPVAVLANNGLEWLTRLGGSVAIMPQAFPAQGVAALLTAIITLVILFVLGFRGGRTWCNTVCPVGTLLGLISRFALVRPRMDATKCTHCGQCARVCKAGCLDTDKATGKAVADASRCVACFNCVDVCKFGALSLTASGEKTAVQGRRSAIASLAMGITGMGVTGLVLPKTARADGDESGNLAVTHRGRRGYPVPILPPGAQNARHFADHCTACQLCVSACPNNVLQSRDNGGGMLQPAMHFERGFCRLDCTKCGEVCPTGAIMPIRLEEKTAIQVGRARIEPDLCVITTDKVPCTACQRACPAGAISLVGEGEIKRPAVDPEKCTGCGACEYHCPARPLAAIQVESNLEHRKI